MKSIRKVLLLFTLSALTLATSVHAQTVDGNQDTIQAGKYTLLNNKYGNPDAYQNIWGSLDNSALDWGSYFWKGDPNTFNIPAAVLGWHWSPPRTSETGLPVRISADRSVITRANWTLTRGGDTRLNVSYSLWFHTQLQQSDGLDYTDNPEAKIGIWLHDEGGLTPAGGYIESLFIQDVLWDVWRDANGSTQAITFRANPGQAQQDGPVNDKELELRDFIDYAVTSGWISDNRFLSGVEFGAEVEIGQNSQLDVEDFYIDVLPGNASPQPGQYANAALLNIVPASVDINVELDGWWEDYKNSRTFSFPQNGQTVTRTRFEADAFGSETTNSEFQGVALTLAVYADDQVVFDQLWRYTKNYLDEGNAPGLMPYEINSDGSVKNRDSASDGDRDIAFALIAAHQKWGSVGIDYEGEARDMLDAIWEYEVITPDFPDQWDSDPDHADLQYEDIVIIKDDAGQPYIPDVFYMTVGNWGKDPFNMFVGVAYASPATLRVFDAFSDNLSHDWERVANDYYTILERTHTSMTSGSTFIDGQPYTGSHPASNGFLLPAWTLPTGQSLDSQTFFAFGDPVTYDSYLNFARDSARLPLHLMMDLAWFPDANRGGKAEIWIDRMNWYFNDLLSFREINDGYNLDGSKWRFNTDYENAFFGTLATATMRDTIDGSGVEMNAWRQSAWDDNFADFTVTGLGYSDDWRLYSAYFLGFEMQNPMDF